MIKKEDILFMAIGGSPSVVDQALHDASDFTHPETKEGVTIARGPVVVPIEGFELSINAFWGIVHKDQVK